MAATEQELGELHSVLATVLKDAVQADAAPAAILAVAAKFLKDNNITCGAEGDNAMAELQKALDARRKRASITPGERKELGSLADVEHLMH